MFSWKTRDLLRLKHERALQLSKAFAREFDQMPSRWWWVLKVVMDSVDRAQARLERFCTDGGRFEEVAQVGDDRL